MFGDKINKKSNIASVVELFMMFLLLLIVIVVITLVCMTAREQSLDAGDLTKAVICAENPRTQQLRKKRQHSLRRWRMSRRWRCRRIP